MRVVSVAAALSALAMMLAGCAHEVVVSEALQQPLGSPVFTRCNLWYVNCDDISCLNIQQGRIIPFGTEITPIKATNRKVTFKTSHDGHKFTIYFDNQLMMITMHDYIRQIFTLQKPEELAEGISQEMLARIRQGDVVPGMTKNEVLLAYGTPAAFRTPSLQNSTWVYWIAADQTIRVVFRGDQVRSIININTE